MKPYPVQMLAVVALYNGYLTEVDTGEGKTLSIAMAVAIAAWSGDPVHVITANDYLASRDAKQMKGFFEEGNDDQPIYMINLLKFKEKAEYKDGRETSLSGREAYALYGEIIEKHLIEIGGELIFKSKVTRITVGKVDELWDAIAIAKWPSKKVMGENMMPSDPDLLEGYRHREAGLAGQLNIESIDGLFDD